MHRPFAVATSVFARDWSRLCDQGDQGDQGDHGLHFTAEEDLEFDPHVCCSNLS
jgi:hypothetical protein